MKFRISIYTLLLTTLFVINNSRLANAQWSLNGTTIVYTLDKVGINSSTPTYNLDVYGTIRANDFTTAEGKNIIIGNDTYLTDVDYANILGV
jgi:hypothetical protein